MSRSARIRLRPRVVAMSGSPVLAALTLRACCSDDGPGVAAAVAGGVDQVCITGDPGEAPKVEWKAQTGSDATESEVITEGDGAPDQLFVIDIRAAG